MSVYEKRMQPEIDTIAECSDCEETRFSMSRGAYAYIEPYFKDSDTGEVLCSGCAVKVLNLALIEARHRSSLGLGED